LRDGLIPERLSLRSIEIVGDALDLVLQLGKCGGHLRHGVHGIAGPLGRAGLGMGLALATVAAPQNATAVKQVVMILFITIFPVIHGQHRAVGEYR
jgi:hypothetical protein